MTFTKQIAPATKIDAFRSFAAQTKRAFVAERNGSFVITEFQTNSRGLDRQWVVGSKAEAVSALVGSGYEIEAAA